MKLEGAHFVFKQRHRQLAYRVIFVYGERPTVNVYLGNERIHVIPNHDRSFKPCVTHAKYAIEHATKKAPRTQHAKNKLEQIKKAKPLLRVVDDE